MINLNIEEKIKKSFKFISKMFNKAVVEIRVINDKNYYMEINEKDYIIHENYDGKCNGILIIQDGDNNFYDFKNILKSIPEYFAANGMVFIRYDLSEFDDENYISNQFTNFLKLNKYVDVEEYKLLSNDNVNEIFISARYHLQLLDKENEYEDYEANFYVNRKGCKSGCGGCGGGGCSSGGCGGGGCSSCEKQCCKK